MTLGKKVNFGTINIFFYHKPFGHTGHRKKKILKMGIYRKISFLSIKAEISTLDDFLALFMNRRIIFSQRMQKKIFRRKHLATLSQRSPVKCYSNSRLSFSINAPIMKTVYLILISMYLATSSHINCFDAKSKSTILFGVTLARCGIHWLVEI